MVVGCKLRLWWWWCRLAACKCVRALSLFQVAAFHWSFPNWTVHILVSLYTVVWAAMAS